MHGLCSLLQSLCWPTLYKGSAVTGTIRSCAQAGGSAVHQQEPMMHTCTYHIHIIDNVINSSTCSLPTEARVEVHAYGFRGSVTTYRKLPAVCCESVARSSRHCKVTGEMGSRISQSNGHQQRWVVHATVVVIPYYNKLVTFHMIK